MNLNTSITQIYIDNKWEELVYTTAGIPLPFNSLWKKIGFNISGGADSTLLCFTLCKHIVDNKLNIEIHTISHIRCWQTRPWQRDIRLNVINKLKTIFPTLIFIEHENYIPAEIEMSTIGAVIPTGNKMRSGDQLENSSFATYVGFNFNLDATFCATTNNPDAFKDSGGDPSRNRSTKIIHYKELVYSKNNLSYPVQLKPFVYHTKDTVIKSYFDLGIADLLSVTRSCEGEQNSYDGIILSKENTSEMSEHKFRDAYKYYKSGDYVPECNICFWCLEKNWALKEIKQ